MPTSLPSVCIIGAGAAGLIAARALAERGCPVVILEGGSESPAPALEDTYRVKSIGIPHRGAHGGRFRALGGSTTRWGGQLWPWERHEFEARPALGIEGWPIGYDEVASWYGRAFASLGLTQPTVSPSDPAMRGVLSPALDPHDFTIKYSTWLPWRRRNLGRTIGQLLRRLPNVELRLDTTAVRVEMAGDGRKAVAVRARDSAGTEIRIPCDIVVVAAGAIESSRLLFASGNLGDAGGWLGRGFMDHLSVRIARFLPRDRRAFNAMFAPVLKRGVLFTPRMVLQPSLLEREGLLSAYGHWDTGLPPGSGLALIRETLREWQAGRRRPISLAELRGLLAGAVGAFALARGMVIDGRRYFPRDAAIYLRIDTEQLPDRESRVAPTGERDSLGLARMTLDWRVSEVEKQTVRRAAELLGAELERRGIGTLQRAHDPFAPEREWGDLRGDSFHMMGGTRMAKSAPDGVVDVNARVFGTENVYVAGASIFPTGGMANPTLTLIALTLRLADHLARLHSTAP